MNQSESLTIVEAKLINWPTMQTTVSDIVACSSMNDNANLSLSVYPRTSKALSAS